MRTNFCDNRCEELGYNAVLAVMYIFCYFNPVDSPTRYRYMIFYTVMFFENTALLSLWYMYAGKLWYRYYAIAIHYVFFALGLVFMVRMLNVVSSNLFQLLLTLYYASVSVHLLPLPSPDQEDPCVSSETGSRGHG